PPNSAPQHLDTQPEYRTGEVAEGQQIPHLIQVKDRAKSRAWRNKSSVCSEHYVGFFRKCMGNFLLLMFSTFSFHLGQASPFPPLLMLWLLCLLGSSFGCFSFITLQGSSQIKLSLEVKFKAHW
ncbi:hypothetical protein Nmel_008419, partial [Mimus melanotis]